MAPTVHITLDPGPWDQADWKTYRPAGGSVSGKVIIDCLEPLACRAVRVAVGWHTEGRGDQDSMTIFEEKLHEGQLRSGMQEFPFGTRLPAGPISYAGHYIQLIWQVEARLDLAWKSDPQAALPFQLIASPIGT